MGTKIKVGLSGFSMARGKYYKIYEVVELQDTFYEIKKVDYYKKLREEAPEKFEFVIKVSQLITHPPSSPTYKRLNIEIKNPENYGFFKPTEEVFNVWEHTERIGNALRCNVFLFQTPASFKPSEENIENIKRFFTSIKRDKKIMCWESRGKWSKDEIEKICKSLSLVDVVDPFEREGLPGETLYYRIHGGRGYRKSYSEKELLPLALKLKGKRGYVFFNNLSRIKDSQIFLKLIEKI